MQIPVIFLTFLLASTLSSMSGGGTGILTLPVLLMLGISLPTSIAINQITGAFWVLPASYNYLKNRKKDITFLAIFTFIGLFGVYFGVSANIHLDRRILELTIGIMIILLAAYTLLNKNLGIRENVKEPNSIRKLAAYPFALILGFYESFFGSGNGILFSMVTFHTRGFDFIDALGHYYIVVFFWVILSAFLYARNGYYSLELTIPAVAGGIIGGYIGSRLGKYKGNTFIKLAFVTLGVILGLKLIAGI